VSFLDEFFVGFLGSFCIGFLAVPDFWLYLTRLHIYLAYADMIGQSVAIMQLMALYRLKFGLSY
jgi:hypothetical protein